ncbi:transporter [Saccharothrix sp. NRRL B-16348]|uniref:ABC transporter permease subunit n=1 Tax=Saccharothrix sp. NRRL B-16348 TaxID=1415542 RepID=UPI0003C95A19|nr:ABC transporter permease subunit [Saccharothrix sp. NRRL B-16348]AGZ94311.1 putative transmembrane transport protein [Saccharothrix sp. NRRL B-16348]KOX18621.1 transporter [Saccharothrix sp. NRRL B-16348]
MTWLTWRQLRFPVVSVYAALALIGVGLAVSRPVRGGFGDQEFPYLGSLLAVQLLPAVLGVFWGVPMITRELETGTHNLVWNQSVTRSRWLAVKLGVGVPAAMVAAGVLSLVVTWWADPIDSAAALETERSFEPRITPLVFVARGIAPIGYAAFAFVLGIAVAILLRRTVTAMAVTLVVYAAVQLAVPFAVRPHVLPPVEESVTLTARSIAGVQTEESPNGYVPQSLRVLEPAGSWVLANETVDANGAVVRPLPAAVGDCMPAEGTEPPTLADLDRMRECFARLSYLGYRQHLAYQPASRFWPAQWVELAVFLALSALVTWFCFRRLRHLS